MRAQRMAATMAVSAGLLAGCSSVQGAVDAAQGVVEQADSLVAVAADVAAACTTAAAAWAPGVTPKEARAAITEATGMLDEVIAVAPDVPGVSAVGDILATAQEALAQDPSSTSLGVSRATLEAACAVFTLGG